jgi:hypothetical protein
MVRTFIAVFTAFILLASCNSFADNLKYSKQDIRELSELFLKATDIKNPVFADVDNDGDFDILKFTKAGFVEFHKNTASNSDPIFILADKKFDDYEVHSIFGTGLPFPVFMADSDGDGDKDLFAITGKVTAAGSNVEIVENSFEVTQYMLITIILILGIIALLIYIL